MSETGRFDAAAAYAAIERAEKNYRDGNEELGGYVPTLIAYLRGALGDAAHWRGIVRTARDGGCGSKYFNEEARYVLPDPGPATP